MLIRFACDAYKAVIFIVYPCLSLGWGFVGAVSDRGVLCLVGELDGEGAFGVGIGVEGARDDVEHA
jgi:hypothetical protein